MVTKSNYHPYQNYAQIFPISTNMDPPPASPPPPTTTLPPLPSTKLRLMCSYGGQIVPRPNNKSLFYSGGETRIVAVDRRTTLATLSACTAHLSRTLYNNRPFTLKYQLPNEDIGSLISVTTDEDLQNMLEEHDRIVISPTPSRIRLFLFPTKAESVGTILLDPKSESWFSDALKSTLMIQRGQSADAGLGNGLMGFEGLGLSDSSMEAQGENNLLDFGSESMVLETNSSFGSTNSSISMSNLPPIGVYGEDGGINFKAVSSGSIESDNSVASAVSYPKMGVHQDQAVPVTSLDTKVFSHTVQSDSVIFDPSSISQMQKAAQVFGHQLSHASEQTLHQQEVPYILAGAHNISQYPTGPMPISSYYPMYNTPLHQQQQSPYPPNPPYPIYLLHVRPTQSYNMSMVHNLNNIATVASSRPPLHPHTTMIGTHVTYKEVTEAPRLPELASDIYQSTVHSNREQQYIDPFETYHPSQFVPSAPLATADYNAEHDDDDDLAYAQIYKSQPPAPARAPSYETVTKAETVLLSDTLPQLHGTSQL